MKKHKIRIQHEKYTLNEENIENIDNAFKSFNA